MFEFKPGHYAKIKYITDLLGVSGLESLIHNLVLLEGVSANAESIYTEVSSVHYNKTDGTLTLNLVDFNEKIFLSEVDKGCDKTYPFQGESGRYYELSFL